MARNHDRTFGLIDRSTGDSAMHVVRRYVLRSEFEGEGTQLWPFVLSMPLGVSEKITESELEEAAQLMQRKDPRCNLSPFESLVICLRLKGADSPELLKQVNQAMARVLYERFCRKQIAAGNSAWLAPSFLRGAKGSA